MRTCTRCNRPLTDPEFHDIEEAGTAPPRIAGWFKGHPVFDIPEGWEPKPRFRGYSCKVRLVGTSPTTGKTIVPRTPQRIEESDARYVHETRFEGDLKP